MEHKIEENKLIVEFNPQSKTLSKSGKTFLLASSGGFIWTEDEKHGLLGISYTVVRRRKQ